MKDLRARVVVRTLDKKFYFIVWQTRQGILPTKKRAARAAQLFFSSFNETNY